MKQTITFKLNAETELPQDFINSIPRQGRADEAVEDLRSVYEIECSEDDARKFLKSTGDWQSDELTDHGSNLDRLIWLACLDCQENETTYFYMGA